MHDNGTVGDLAEWLKKQRKARDWTQEELAIQVDCSVETLRRLERGLGLPSKQTAALIAQCFSIPPAQVPEFILWARQRSGAKPPASIITTTPTKQENSKTAPDLPATMTPLVGRAADVERVMQRLLNRDVRLLTLTGPAGIGKTRLAVATAQAVSARFDGVIYVPLSTIADPQLIIPTIEHFMDLVGPISSRPGAVRLLVLDNFEHLIAAASQVGQLLEEHGKLKALITSREILHIYGEEEFPVQPLGLPEYRLLPSLTDLEAIAAIKLFVQRAQSANPDFALTQDNAPAVALICKHLDGLPLAIELAAARLKILSPQALLDRLQDSFNLLTGGPRNLPDRQRTMQGAIDWSYRLLAPEEQRLFARLSTFAGGFSVEAAAKVCDPEEGAQDRMLDRLEELLDKSLLRKGEGAFGELRFGMLEVIRQYAAARLADSDETLLLRERHAVYYLQFAKEIPQRCPDLETEMQYMIIERANFHALIRWAMRERHEHIIEGLGRDFWTGGTSAYIEGPVAAGWEVPI